MSLSKLKEIHGATHPAARLKKRESGVSDETNILLSMLADEDEESEKDG